MTVPAMPRRCATIVRMSPQTVAFSRPPLSITITLPSATSSMKSPTVPAGTVAGPYKSVKARPDRRNRGSRGLIPRHCPGMPSRANASLSAVVSSFDARCTFSSISSSPLQHAFVIGSHDIAYWRSCTDCLRHQFFLCYDLFRSVEHAQNLGLGDEHDGAGIGNHVVSRRHKYVADGDPLVRSRFHETSPGRRAGVVSRVYREIMLPALVDVS